jgi:hypothetical protein
MAVLDVVVPALFAARVARQAVGLPELFEARLTPGDDLVDVCLVAGVPEHCVARAFHNQIFTALV